MEKIKTVRRQRRKILSLNKIVENFTNKIELLQEKVTKSDNEIVILQEDLAEASELVKKYNEENPVEDVKSESSEVTSER